MATKRRDVLLPLSHEGPVVLTPRMANEPPKHKPSMKHGFISSYLCWNARIIIAGILLILLLAFGTRYAPHLSCYIPHIPYLNIPRTHSVNSYRREIRYLWTTYDFDTTVVYIYSGNDELYPDNLNYFLRHGVKEGTVCSVID